MNNEELFRDIDDLNMATNNLKSVMRRLSSQMTSIQEKTEIFNRLTDENKELLMKIVALEKLRKLAPAESMNTAEKPIEKPKSQMPRIHGFGSTTSAYQRTPSQFEYILKNLNPFIERGEIKQYFSKYGNVAYIDLTPDGVKRHSLVSADALIAFTTKPDDALFSTIHFMRDAQVKVLPKVVTVHDSSSDESEKAPVSKCPSVRGSTTSLVSTYSTASTVAAGMKSRSVMVIEFTLPMLTHAELRTYFERFGQIVNVTDIPKCKVRRLLFIKFQTFEAAEKSIGQHQIGTRNLTVRYAKDF